MTQPIAVFQLELEEAPLMNTVMRMHWMKKRRLMERIGLRILSQLGNRGEPLRGKPRILMTRFSTKKPDQDSAGSKLWLDVLVRLGWLRDDGPDHIELISQWEKAAPGQGRVVVHIFESAQANAEYEREQGWVP